MRGDAGAATHAILWLVAGIRMAAGMKPVSLSRFRARLSRIMSRLVLPLPGTGTQSALNFSRARPSRASRTT
jgi:hypothetical protein